jgi:hypothetical protein
MTAQWTCRWDKKERREEAKAGNGCREGRDEKKYCA